jgi:hypothetical protein
MTSNRRMLVVDKLVDKLIDEAAKSKMKQKHACVAIRNGKVISPMFHNYIRDFMFHSKCGSAHAEMAVLNYLINTLWSADWCEKQQCILQGFG